MLRGRFGDTTGRPFIEAHVHLVRPGIRFNLSFLVDTGADRTLITPMEGARMGLDYSKLRPGRTLEGLGGSVKGYEEPAILTFEESRKRLVSYTFEIGIAEPRRIRRSQHPEDVVVLLGRDVLQNFAMSYNQRREHLSLKVLAADFARRL
jgi:predicted aspartyl protease